MTTTTGSFLRISALRPNRKDMAIRENGTTNGQKNCHRCRQAFLVSTILGYRFNPEFSLRICSLSAYRKVTTFKITSARRVFRVYRYRAHVRSSGNRFARRDIFL